MSERNRGGGTPGNPPRIPGIPSNAAFHELGEWRTLNAQRPRPSIQDQEMAWTQNLMPVGAYYLRAIPDHGPAIYGVPTPPFASFGVSLGVPPSGPPLVFDINSETNGRIVVQKNPPIPPYGPPQIVSNTGTFGPMTTVSANELIVVCVSADIPASFGPSPIVTSIAGAGLTFQRRFIFQSNFDSNWNGYSTPVAVDMEVWWAIAPLPLTNETFTVTFNAPVESAVFGALGIENVDISGPWDGTPVSNFNPHFYSVMGYTLIETGPLNTTVGNDIVLAFFSYYANDVVFGYVYPTPWGGNIRKTAGDPEWESASILVVGSNLLGDWNAIIGYYNSYTSPQTGLMPFGLSASGPFATDWIAYADAVKGLPLPNQVIPTSLRAVGLGMPASATTFLFAAWVNIPGAVSGDAFNLMVDTETNTGISVTLSLSGSTWTVHGSTWDSGNAIGAAANVNAGVDFTMGWHSVAVQIDTATQTFQMLVDEAYATAATSGTGNPIAMGPADVWEIGGNQKVALNLGQLWFGVGQPFFDLSVLGNQQAIFGPTNCVLDWGVNGEAITGVEPQVFLLGDAPSPYPTNFGTGGPFTVVGAATFANAGSVPPLCP